MIPRPTCPSCERLIADAHDWEHIPPGEGTWLCWDAPNCIHGPERAKPVPAVAPDAEARIMARLDALAEKLDQLLATP